MATPPIGLDISPSSIATIALKKRGKAYSITSRAESPLESGIVADGEVHNIEALSSALSAYWREHGIKEKRVAIGIANQRCVTRVIDLPRIRSKKQLKEALSFEVADNLPIPIEETIWDYHTIARFKDESHTEKERHVVVMAYRESVERWRDAIEGAGLKLARVDLAGFALMRSGLAAAKFGIDSAEELAENEAVALIDIGPTSSNIVVSRNDTCELNRLIAFGRQHFTHTMVEQFGWSVEDAHRTADGAGVVPIGGVEQPDDPYNDARRVMEFVADRFAHEIKTSLDYYAHSTNGKHRVSRVVIAGEGALLRGLDQRVAREIGMPVSVLDASPRLDPDSVEKLGAEHARYGTALGLAMEDAA